VFLVVAGNKSVHLTEHRLRQVITSSFWLGADTLVDEEAFNASLIFPATAVGMLNSSTDP